MRRRKFIGLLGGAALAMPLAARAQTQTRRRIGILKNLAADDLEGQARLSSFLQGLQEHGWRVGQNLQIEYRWATTDAARQKAAAELVALSPEVLLATASSVLGALQQATATIPIVFCQTTDPVGGGYVASLARPGGNTTGFSQAEYGLSGKWLELLKEVAPGIKRALVVRDPRLPAGIGQFGALQTAAAALGIELTPVGPSNLIEIEHALAAFARDGHGGLVVTAGATVAAVGRSTITPLSIKHRVPAVYPFRYHVTAGGLMSYGADTLDQFRRAAGYVDRILKGENPASLPVQAPTKFELVINMKTARAMGLTMPPMLLARADEVIE